MMENAGVRLAELALRRFQPEAREPRLELEGHQPVGPLRLLEDGAEQFPRAKGDLASLDGWSGAPLPSNWPRGQT